jgi:competence protein ComEA
MSQDWTTGAAKWAAVIVLGGASIFGMAWSVMARSPRVRAADPPPAQVIPAANPEAEQAPVAEPASIPPPHSAARQININTATASELELLPGIGPALAGRIVEYRKAHGPFKSVDGLDEVKGIGPRTLEKLRPLVKVE